jgi:hypothetical protein
MIELAFEWAAKLIVAIRPIVPAICFAVTWLFIASLVFSLVAMVKQGAANIRQMHKIPCAGCRYATQNYRLKCSVHPTDAFSEQAINCTDFAKREEYYLDRTA